MSDTAGFHWISDPDSGLAHMSLHRGATRSTRCGIGLNGMWSTETMILLAKDKPRCSVCTEWPLDREG